MHHAKQPSGKLHAQLLSTERARRRGRIVAAAVEMMEARVFLSSTPIIVNSNLDNATDAVITGTTVTLREAVNYANQNGGGTINFAPSMAGQTIALSNGPLTVAETTGSLTIDASSLSGGVTISGNTTSRIFMDLTQTTVTLDGLTMTQGFGAGLGGGGAYVSQGAALTLENDTFSDDSSNGTGGAVYDAGSLSASDTTFSDNQQSGAGEGGGAVDITGNGATATVAYSTFSDNYANSGFGGAVLVESGGSLNANSDTFTQNQVGSGGYGGSGIAVLSSSTLTVSNSTFDGNIAPNAGGGVLVLGGSAQIDSDTFTQNQAADSIPGTGGGGIAVMAGSASVIYSTIVGNMVDTAGDGGGIYIDAGAQTTLVDSIVASNTVSGTTTADDIGGVALSAGSTNDLIGTGGSGGLANGVAANQVGVANPLLGALSNNGGPTQTIPLLAGSPAIGAGTAVTGITSDQRGILRPATAPDIGALQTPDTFPVPVIASVSPGLNPAGGNPASGGFLVTVASATTSAFDLTPGWSITMGGVPVQAVSATPQKIIFLAPSEGTWIADGGTASTDIPIVFHTAGGASSNAEGIEYAAPQIVGNSPAPSDAGGTSLTLQGMNLLPTEGGSLVVGGVTIAPSQILSSTYTQIVFTAPALASLAGGSTAVQVTNPDGQVSSAYDLNYQTPTPTITTITGGPSNVGTSTSVPAIGGTTVTISGGGLYNATSTSLTLTVNGTIVPVTQVMASLFNPTGELTFTMPSTVAEVGTGGAIASITFTDNGVTSNSMPLYVGNIGSTVVTSSDDNANLVGYLSNDNSLRDAIAYTDAIGGGTITFSPSLAGQTITLTSSTQISLTPTADPIIIDASGIGGIAINGNGGAVFQVYPMANVTLNDLTIAGANGVSTDEPGAIVNAGTLSLSQCTLSQDSGAGGGGIYNTSTGTLTVTASTFSDDGAGGQGGGGIYNAGILDVTSSTFSDDTAEGTNGGAVVNAGTMNVVNSTFDGDTASAAGNSGGRGGGIFNEGALTVQFSTFDADAANEGGADIYLDSGTGALTNSIFASSTAGDDIGQLVTGLTGSHDLVDDGSAPSSFTNNVVGSADLGTLGNYGGPTETIPLLPGSSAIGAGSAVAGITTDQRGVARPATPDIGAYQTTSINVASVTVSSTNLNSAVAKIGDKITFTVALSGPFTVTGAPTLTLSDAMVLTDPTVLGNSLAFSFTVAAGEDTSALNATAFNATGITPTHADGVNTSGFDGTTDGSSIQIITTPPTVSFAPATTSDPIGAPDVYTVTFNRPVTGLSAADFDSAGSASVAISSLQQKSATSYTVAVTPATSGTIQLQIGSSAVIQDAAGNLLVTPATDTNVVSAGDVSLAATTNFGTATSDFGYNVIFTATIVGAGTPTGTVQFLVNGVDAGAPVTLVDGAATYSTPLLSIGSNVITADYSGDANFPSGSASVTQQVAFDPSVSTPPGTFSATGKDDSTAQFTNPGYFQSNTDQTGEIPASLGYYAPGYGNIAAKQASPGYYVPTQAATTETAADPGYFVASSGQSAETPAPLGYYVPASAATAATAALPGYYVSTTAATAATAAPSGYYVNAAAATAPTIDPAGTFSVQNGAQGATEPTPAPLGAYVPNEGATAATEALPGYYVSTTGATAPTAAGLGFYVPTAGAYAETEALPGYYVPTIAATAATEAQPGYYVSTAGASVATEAQPGYYVAATGATAATEAQPGYYVPIAGTTAATEAQPGYYVSTAGASVATEAQPGYYVAATGATAATEAQPGYYVPIAGATAATEAQPGHYVSMAGASLATEAQLGYYVAAAGATAATEAQPGYYVPTAGGTAATEAQPGFFVSSAGADSEAAALPGTFVSTYGATSPTAVPSGYYVNATGAVAPNIDPVGTYSITVPGALVGAIEPTLAPPGSYVPSQGATAVTVAGPGYYVSTYGASSETPDPAGTTSGAGAAQAIPTVTLDPDNITYGTVLANSQLTNSTTTVPGTYSFASAAGTTLSAGSGQVETVTFTPNDTTDFATVVTTVDVNVGKFTPSVTVSDPGGPSTGSPYTATATVTGVSNTTLSASGVTFTYYTAAGATLGTTLSSAPSAAGTYAVIANYPGDGLDYGNASSQPAFFSITDVTATVNVAAPSEPFTGSAYTGATGSVLGNGNVNLGTPTFTYYNASDTLLQHPLSGPPTTVGSYLVVGNYAGGNGYVASSSTAVPFSITKATPKISVTDAGGVYSGSPFAATATLTGVTGSSSTLESISPTLTYYTGTAATGASTTTAPSAAGTYTVVASFPGSTDYTSATSSAATFTISKATPSVTASDAGGVYDGSPFAATGTVTAPGLSTTPTSFSYVGTGSTVYAASATAPTNAGTYTVTASYTGTGNYASASSTATPFTISAASTSVALQSSLTGSAYYGESVTLTATVSVVAPGKGTPTGSVQFFDNGVSLGTVALSGTAATLATTSLAIGTDAITATYIPGSANFATSTNGTALSQTVNVGLLLLDASGSGSLTVSGAAKVVATGNSIVVDSSSATAINVSGSASISDSLTDVVGKASITGAGKVSSLQTGQTKVADPFASLATPTTTGLTTRSTSTDSIAGSTVVTLQPGVYIGGINIGGAAKVTLAPGEYYLQGGGFNVAGSAVVTGTGVFIYDAPTKSTDQFTVSGAAALSLTPMTTGAWAGVTIFQARTATNAIDVSGSGTVDVTGDIYAADATVDISGAAAVDTFGNTLIAYDLIDSGSGELVV